MLENLVAEKKFVFGDDVLEITASDIKEASRKIRVFRPTSIRYRNIQVITKVYVIACVLMMLGAIYYTRIIEFFQENRTQAMLFIIGAVMTLIGILLNSVFMLRRRRYLEIEKMIIETSSKTEKRGLKDSGVD